MNIPSYFVVPLCRTWIVATFFVGNELTELVADVVERVLMLRPVLDGQRMPVTAPPSRRRRLRQNGASFRRTCFVPDDQVRDGGGDERQATQVYLLQQLVAREQVLHLVIHYQVRGIVHILWQPHVVLQDRS